MLDHLAAHIDSKPLLVDVPLIAIQHVRQRQVALRQQSRQEHRALEAQRDRLEVGRAHGRIADQEHRRAGEWMIFGPRPPQLTAGRIAGPVQHQRDPDDLQVADDRPVGFRGDLRDEAVHRLGDMREVAAQPLAVEP